MLQAFAALLDHRTAGLVARCAANAAAVLCVFAFANANREVALAAANTVDAAIAATEPIGQHPAQILQRAASDFVVAAAMDLAAVIGLFEFDRAPRQNAPIGARGRTCRPRTRLDSLDRARERRDRR